MEENFDEFFEKATGFKAYPYQKRIAEKDYFSSIIDIPTGLGKTAGIVIGWLWRRRKHNDEKIRETTPRRLIYCLPMRVLVEQTKNNIIMWLNNLDLLGGSVKFNEDGKGKQKELIYNPSWEDPEKITVTVLMGGESKDMWDIYPERDAIIIGTQDMLISRALNRGYGMSKYRWPIHFGLLNNDSLWIMDEVQLMGNGLNTSLQMEAFRNDFKTIKKTQTVWMSATINHKWLKTIDFKQDFRDNDIIRLSEEDLDINQIKKIVYANKNVAKISSNEIIDTVINNHLKGTISIIIANTVARSKEIYNALKKKNISAKILLIHSQFRPPERHKIITQMLQPPKEEGTIIVSTQVIEAGLDISAHTLITELAPWPSLVQRFGRCNRKGEYSDAKVFWIDLLEQKKERTELPYNTNELEKSKKILIDIENVSISELSEKLSKELERSLINSEILRKKDIFELFDTTSDIIGGNIDISKYVRDIKDTNVQVFWRDIKGDIPTFQEPLPSRDELCPAPISDLKRLADKKIGMWTWDYFEGEWVKVLNSTEIFPGQQILLKANEGHYSEIEGWDIEREGYVSVLNIEGTIGMDKYDDDSNIPTQKNDWKSIAEHTDEVIEKATLLCKKIALPDNFKESILEAVRWHDAGKSHKCFQNMLNETKIPQNTKPVAKAPKDAWIKNEANKRRHFRHELVSGLLAIQNKKSDLIAYLAASHHGKVRLSIRSMPDEIVPGDTSIRFARGVWDGDEIPETSLGGGVIVPQTKIDLSLMELGDGKNGPSWLSRTLNLCEDPNLGIFILGFLESIVRAADERASGGLH
ncbi:MAG: CRISPR-associated helicase Cas3' [Thermoplasmata archaeon]